LRQRKKLMGNQQVAITSCTSQTSSSNGFHAIGNSNFRVQRKVFALFAKGKYNNYILALFFVIVSSKLEIDLPAVKSSEKISRERFTTQSTDEYGRDCEKKTKQTSSHRKQKKEANI
jgi:hypothetical protein